MAYDIKFNISQTGAETLDRVGTAVQQIGAKSGETGFALKALEATIRADIAAGKSLEESLQAVSKESARFGASISSSAREVLAQDRVLQQLGRTMETAYAENARRAQKATDDLAKSQRNAADEAQRMGKIMAQAQAENAKRDAGPQISGAGIRQAVQNPLGSVAQGLAGFASGLGPVGVGIAAVGAEVLALITASGSATRSLADLGIETQNLSLKLGLSTKEVGEFQFAARASGQDISVFETGMRKLSQGLADGGEEGKKTREALDALGVKTRTLNGDIRPTSDILGQVADGLNRIDEPARRNAEAIKLFGRSGIELIPVLAHLNENISRAKELGVGITDTELARFTKYQGQITAVDAAWERAKRNFSEGIAGTILLDVKGAGASLLNSVFGGSRGDAKTPVAGIHSGSAGAVQSYLLSQLGNFKDSSQLAHSSALIGGDEARFQGTLPGAQAALADAKGKAEEARTAYFGSKGQVDNTTADQLQKKWQDAEAAALKYEDRVKILTKSESQRVASMEKASDLDKSGEGYLRFAGLHGDDFVTRTEQQSAVSASGRRAPSLRRPGEYNPDEEAFRDLLASPLSGGSYGDTFVSTTADRLQSGEGLTKAIAGIYDARQKGQDEQDKHDAQIKELQSRGLESATAGGFNLQRLGVQRTAGLAGDGSAGVAARFSEAQQLAQIDQQEATARLGLETATLSRVKNLYGENSVEYQAQANKIVEIEGQTNDQIYSAKTKLLQMIHDEQLKQADAFKGEVGGLFDAATSRQPNAIPNFFKSQVLGLGKSVTEGLAGEAFKSLQPLIPHVSDSNSFLGKALANTPFGADPLKDSASALDISAGKLSDAADAITAAAGGGSGSGSSSGGGLPIGAAAGSELGGLDPSWLSLPAFSGASSTIAASSKAASALARILGGGSNGIVGLPGTDGSDSGGLDPSWTALPGIDGTSATSYVPGISTTATSLVKRISAFNKLFGGGSNYGTAGVDGQPGQDLGYAGYGTPGVGDQPGEDLGDLPTSSGFGANAKTIGSIGAAVGGGIAAFQDFKKGGAGGALEGTGAILGSAAGIAALFGPAGAPVALGLGIAALGTSLLGSFFNSRQRRENDITNELSANQYLAPTALNVTQDSSGHYSDFDARGNIRTSNLSPYPQVSDPYVFEKTHGFFGGPPTFTDVPGQTTSPFGSAQPTTVVNVTHNYGAGAIQTIDSTGFQGLLDRNKHAVGNAVASHIQDASPSRLVDAIKFNVNN